MKIVYFKLLCILSSLFLTFCQESSRVDLVESQKPIEDELIDREEITLQQSTEKHDIGNLESMPQDEQIDHAMEHGNPIVFNSSERAEFGTPQFWSYIGLSFFLVCFAGLMSGLTVGYLSIDKLDLEIKSAIGTPEEKKYAKVILPILKQHHFLLVTLLLSNAFAMEALPIFLDAVVPSFWAIIISVTAVLFFGEVIPQAVCTGPSQLYIAEKVAPIVKTLMFCLAIVCYPISKLLDIILGEHDITRYKNDQLKQLVQLHSRQALVQLQHEVTGEMGLSRMQTNIITGAFDLRNQTIDHLTTPFNRIFSLSLDSVIDQQTIELIRNKGYSRIPIYYGENKSFILGVLIVKSLIGHDQSKPRTLKELSMAGIANIRTPIYASPQATVGNMLNIFKEGTAHLAIVVEDPQVIVEETNLLLEAIKQGKDEQLSLNTHEIYGIITLEKIIEQIISTDIFDEKDIEKRQRNEPQYSVQFHDESQHNLQEMTELLETSQQIMTEQQRNIFNAKFTQLFAQKLENDVKLNVKDLNKKESGLIYGGSQEYKNLGMDSKFSTSLLDRDV